MLSEIWSVEQQQSVQKAITKINAVKSINFLNNMQVF